MEPLNISAGAIQLALNIELSGTQGQYHKMETKFGTPLFLFLPLNKKNRQN